MNYPGQAPACEGCENRDYEWFGCVCMILGGGQLSEDGTTCKNKEVCNGKDSDKP